MAEMYYCTLDDARTEISATERTIDGDDVMRRVSQVSRRIDRIMGGRATRPYFAPYIETRTIPLNQHTISSYRNALLLRGGTPLLALTGATADGTDVTSVAEGYPHGALWYRQVRITSNGDRWYAYISSCDFPDATITGIWGYHSDYANAWRNSGTTLAADITSAATSFTVSDIDAEDSYGFKPVLSRGQLVRFGTGTDYGILTNTDTDNNTATMVRGVLGSTGAAQTAGTAIYIWDTEEPIRRITARQTGLLLTRRGAYENLNLADTGTIQYPPDLLRELAQVLQDYLNDG